MALPSYYEHMRQYRNWAYGFSAYILELIVSSISEVFGCSLLFFLFAAVHLVTVVIIVVFLNQSDFLSLFSGEYMLIIVTLPVTLIFGMFSLIGIMSYIDSKKIKRETELRDRIHKHHLSPYTRYWRMAHKIAEIHHNGPLPVNIVDELVSGGEDAIRAIADVIIQSTPHKTDTRILMCDLILNIGGDAAARHLTRIITHDTTDDEFNRVRKRAQACLHIIATSKKNMPSDFNR